MVHNRAKASTIVEKFTTKRTNNNNARANAPAVNLQLDHATVSKNGDDTQSTNVAEASIMAQPTMTSAVQATAITGGAEATKSNSQGGFWAKPIKKARDRGDGDSHDTIASHGVSHTTGGEFWTGFELNDTVKTGSGRMLNS